MGTPNYIQIWKADAARRALEQAARKLETTQTNEMYRYAWRRAAQMIRAMKDDIDLYGELKCEGEDGRVDVKVAGPR